MEFIVKPHIQTLLDKAIKDKDAEGQQRRIVEFKSILKLLSFIENNSVEKFNGINSIHRLPPSKTGYSEYRVIDDTESEDRSLWVEVKGLRMSEGDILIELK